MPNLVRVTARLDAPRSEAADGHAAPSAPPRKPSAAVMAAVDAHRADKASTAALAAAAAPAPRAHAAHWAYTGETGPAVWGGLKPDFHLCSTGTAAKPDRHPRRHRRRPGAGAVRLPRQRLQRGRQRPHGAGQRGLGQQHPGRRPPLRAGAVPLPPAVGGAHQRPPVRHEPCTWCTRTPKAAWPWWPAAGARRRAAGGAVGVEQPAAGKGRGAARQRPCST